MKTTILKHIIQSQYNLIAHISVKLHFTLKIRKWIISIYSREHRRLSPSHWNHALCVGLLAIFFIAIFFSKVNRCYSHKCLKLSIFCWCCCKLSLELSSFIGECVHSGVIVALLMICRIWFIDIQNTNFFNWCLFNFCDLIRSVKLTGYILLLF